MKLPGTSGLFKKSPMFENKFCPRQRSCPGQVVSSKKNVDFLEKVLPQAAKLPGTSGFFKKSQFSAQSSAPGSEAAQDKWLLPQKVGLLRKHSAPGSEAARDKWLLQKKVGFLEQSSATGSEAAWDTWRVQNKSVF